MHIGNLLIVVVVHLVRHMQQWLLRWHLIILLQISGLIMRDVLLSQSVLMSHWIDRIMRNYVNTPLGPKFPLRRCFNVNVFRDSSLVLVILCRGAWGLFL